MTNKYDSILFDMDGTLWDAVQSYTKAWNEYFRLEGNGHSIEPELLHSLMGVEEKLLLSQVLPHIEEKDRSLIYKEKIIPIIYRVIELEGGRLYDGVLEGLKQLSKEYKLFIISNCPERSIEYFIRWAGIGELITDSMAHGQNFKPKSENMLLLKKKHGLSNPVYVGDTDSDRIQSEKANIPFFFAEYGFGKCDQYQMKFSQFNEFVEYILL